MAITLTQRDGYKLFLDLIDEIDWHPFSAFHWGYMFEVSGATIAFNPPDFADPVTSNGSTYPLQTLGDTAELTGQEYNQVSLRYDIFDGKRYHFAYERHLQSIAFAHHTFPLLKKWYGTVGTFRDGNLPEPNTRTVYSESGLSPTENTISNQINKIGKIDFIGINKYYQGSFGGHGRISEYALWNFELPPHSAEGLVEGVLPFVVEHDNLVFYAPLYGVKNNDNPISTWGLSRNQTVEDFTSYTDDIGGGAWGFVKVGVTGGDFGTDALNNHLELLMTSKTGKIYYLKRYIIGSRQVRVPLNTQTQTIHDENWILRFHLKNTFMPTNLGDLVIDGEMEFAIGIGDDTLYEPYSADSVYGNVVNSNPQNSYRNHFHGIVIRGDPTAKEYQIHTASRNSRFGSSVSKPFKLDTILTPTDEYWFELKRLTQTTAEITIYSNSGYSVIVERLRYPVDGAVIELGSLKIGNNYLISNADSPEPKFEMDDIQMWTGKIETTGDGDVEKEYIKNHPLVENGDVGVAPHAPVQLWETYF